MFRKIMLYLGFKPVYIWSHRIEWKDGNPVILPRTLSWKWATDEERIRCMEEFINMKRKELGFEGEIRVLSIKEVKG